MEHLFEKISEGVDRSTSLRAIHHRVDRSVFLRSSWFDTWSVAAEREASIGLWEWLKRLLFDRQAWNVYRTTRKILENKEAVRSFLNDRIISSVSNSNVDFFDTVEENPLTKRQREACASDEDATLVVAGAGTGKTSTIVAKIGLLLRTHQCEPSEILAISFTNKSANELAERVKHRLGVDIQISTFHKLGLDILSSTKGGKPLLASFAADPVAC